MGINDTIQKSREPVDIRAMETAVSEQIAGAIVADSGVLDLGNTTTSILGIGGVFTGVGRNVLPYASIILSVDADVPSATDGVEFQFSYDGTDWDTTDEYTYLNGDTVKVWIVQTIRPYFRVQYTNGAVAQTSFTLCVQLKVNAGVTSSHRIADDISGQDDAALSKTILMAERAGGTPDVYTNINATTAGNLKVSLEEADPTAIVKTEPSDNLSISEFGEIRTAPPGNRADVEFIYDEQPLLMDDISTGAGTTTHRSNTRDILLEVNDANNGTTAGKRQHYAVPYTPGSGQEIDATGVMDYAALGGGTAAVFLRTSISGSAVVQTIEQSNWTAKTSGVDWTTSQIFRFSFQSLRVGRIQFALVSDGVITKVAEITNDNVRNSGYWQYPSLPPYWKIYNTATETIVEIGYGDESNGIGFMYTIPVNAAAAALAICETVKSQGGDRLFDMPGFPWVSYNNPNTPRTATSTTVFLPILSIRPAATFNGFDNHALYIPEDLSLQTDNNIFYKILFRPTLTNASFAAVDAIPYSGLEFDVAATAVSGGYEVFADYLQTGTVNRPVGGKGLLERVIMSLGYAGVSDILTIAAVKNTANNAAVQAIIRGRVIR